MIPTKKLALGIGLIISFLSVSVYGQSAAPGLNHFAAGGISFDYPAGYSVTDESTTETQRLIITRKGTSVRLTIVTTRAVVLRNELPVAIENFKQPMLKQVATTLGQGKNYSEPTAFQTEVGLKQAEGLRLRSSGSKARTGEVIWLRLSFRLVGLAFIRSNVDERAGARLWQAVSSSLRVEGLVVVGAMKAESAPTDNATTESPVLNGKALALPHPAYPALARAAHASGTVSVQVLIDEQGNVSSAHAVDGHPLLQAAAVAAARAAKFSPTLLEGEPVKVTGVIKYNFVTR